MKRQTSIFTRLFARLTGVFETANEAVLFNDTAIHVAGGRRNDPVVPMAGTTKRTHMTNQPNLQGPLTEPLDEVTVPATTEPFTVKQQFKNSEVVKFATVWDDFRTHFFGKVEQPQPAVTIRKYKLRTFAPDGPIIAELGGPAKVETTLSVAYALIRRQAMGQPGFLQTNGFANIFYVRDVKDVLCAIRVGLAEDGWVVDAIPVDDPLAWNGKHEIFCPVTT